jgi:hypothetical protein
MSFEDEAKHVAEEAKDLGEDAYDKAKDVGEEAVDKAEELVHGHDDAGADSSAPAAS